MITREINLIALQMQLLGLITKENVVVCKTFENRTIHLICETKVQAEKVAGIILYSPVNRPTAGCNFQFPIEIKFINDRENEPFQAK